MMKIACSILFSIISRGCGTWAELVHSFDSSWSLWLVSFESYRSLLYYKRDLREPKMTYRTSRTGRHRRLRHENGHMKREPIPSKETYKETYRRDQLEPKMTSWTFRTWRHRRLRHENEHMLKETHVHQKKPTKRPTKETYKRDLCEPKKTNRTSRTWRHRRLWHENEAFRKSNSSEFVDANMPNGCYGTQRPDILEKAREICAARERK